MKTAGTLLAQVLSEMGAEGLCTKGCGCKLDDLVPCGEFFGHCVPAKQLKCGCGGSTECEECNGYDGFMVPIEEETVE